MAEPPRNLDQRRHPEARVAPGPRWHERSSVIRPMGASHSLSTFYAAIGVLLLLGSSGPDDAKGTASLFRLVSGSVLLTTGASWLVPVRGRTVVLGWALRVARTFVWIVALALAVAWLWRQ